MNKIVSKMIFGAALLLLVACTQDEMPGDGNTLSEGKYPLEIASVTMDVTHSQQPWGANVPQTRVSENLDSMSSKWDGNETIHVKLGNQETTYEVANANGSLNLTLYWTKRTDNVTAWYVSPETDGTINLANQINSDITANVGNNYAARPAAIGCCGVYNNQAKVSCGNITITLKSGQEKKDDFLSKLTIFGNVEKVGLGGCEDKLTGKVGTITWKKADGSVIETTSARDL